MFSLLIKKFRDSHNLSQEDLAQILISFNGRDSIDVTTISRWERGVNTPSVANQLYTLRKLGIDFTLSTIASNYPPHRLINLLKPRFSRFSAFSDKPYRKLDPSFTYTESNNLENFLMDDELVKFSETMFSIEGEAEAFWHSLSKTTFDDVRVFRFYKGSNLAGHLAYAIMNTLDIITLLEELYKTEFSSDFMPEVDGKTLICFSGYASDLAIYMFFTKVVVRQLANNHRIDWLISHSFINEDWQIHKKLGAKLIYRGDSIENGGVKVGKERFKFVVFNSSVPTLLASPLGVLCEQDLEKKYCEKIELSQE
ncbi:helix-turn-helix domain-containing protein [Shewanella sp.]|uniref:helix-turn-helix domain-containing protein n=1 Tax=Shewanella sp. TaxID=50422 RepID=UPI003A85E4D5